MGGVIEIRDIPSCEYPSRQGLLNDVCRQQNSRGDLIADLLVTPLSVLDFEVVEMVVVLDEVMPDLVQDRESLPCTRDIIGDRDARLRSGTVDPIDSTCRARWAGRA